MSIVTRYLRLNQRELDRAARDPDWLSAFADEVAEQESERAASPSERRTHDTGKAWDALRFLFGQRTFPVDLAHGGQELPGAGDRGYGPPRVLTPEQARLAADALADLPFPALLGDTTAAGLVRADVHPTGLGEDDPDLPHLQAHHAALTAFVRTAARCRHGLLVWSARVPRSPGSGTGRAAAAAGGGGARHPSPAGAPPESGGGEGDLADGPEGAVGAGATEPEAGGGGTGGRRAAAGAGASTVRQQVPTRPDCEDQTGTQGLLLSCGR
ncbi:DUF1877 family protein [Kitasatospora sp. NPDC093102]|uniref:DUF1877 family protein n=1 Tax=Kitasatospora sp. NPDC093102 TaxID=3155069 RepID=UPI00341A6446